MTKLVVGRAQHDCRWRDNACSRRVRREAGRDNIMNWAHDRACHREARRRTNEGLLMDWRWGHRTAATLPNLTMLMPTTVSYFRGERGCSSC